jgi:hypothetical protein
MSEKQESTPNLFDYLEPPLTSGQGTIYDYEASLGESAGATFSYQMDTNPLQYYLRQGDYSAHEHLADLGLEKRVPADIARKEISDAKLDIPIPDRGITRFELDMLKYMKRREQAQLLTMGRRSGPLTSAVGFGAGVVASGFDPANAALAFIPVVPELRYAQWVAEAGSLAQRSAIRAAVGALEGGAGALAIEPYVYYSAQLEHRDYTAANSFMNIAFGTALGGGLHVLGGGAFDYFNAETMRSLSALDAGLEGFKQWRDAAANAPDSVHMDALHTMTRALEEDMPGDVGPVFGLTDREFSAKSYDFSAEQISAARATVVAARVDTGAQSNESSLFQTIRTLGGIKVRDAQGQVTREGAEVLAVLGDTRIPGLINNKRGVSPDYLREALTEDGWFKGRDTSATDIQEMYDLLESAARGEKPLRFGETRGASVSRAAIRELDEAGVKSSDSVTAASIKVAEYRALREREHIDVPDFEPVDLPVGGVKTGNRLADEYLHYAGNDVLLARVQLIDEREAYTAAEFRAALGALLGLDPLPERLRVRQISAEGSDGVIYFDIADENGNFAYIQAHLSPDGKTLIIDNVESVGGANSFGGARFREVARQLVELMPGVQQVEGRRVGGARRKAPAVVRQDLSGLIEQSRADRTQAAFDRQFVDDEPTIRAAEKAAAESADEFKPEDIAADTEMFTAHLESMRARELVTPEMEGMIRAGDEAAAKLEAEAAAWEAAAVCEAGL